MRDFVRSSKVCLGIHVQPLRYYRNNMIAALNVFQAMSECNIFRVVFSSSATVYGNAETVPVSEKRPSDASGNKLSEDQHYKYVNIDPSTLDAHVRACYRVYFGEQVSVSRPSGRAVPCGPDDGPAPASYDQGWDILMKARSEAKKPFLPYCFWQKNTYVNFEGQRSSNDPFETTSTDPRTRLLIQFQSLHMKLLEHSDFQGVEPLFATAYVYSTGSNVGRRVRCMYKL